MSEWNKAIEVAVDKIFADLCGRKGFDLRSLDEEIQQEIKDTWYDIILDRAFD